MSAPRVAFVNRFYAPDAAATGQVLADLAETLAARGWRVSVIAGSGSYDGSGHRPPREEVRNGVTVRRARSVGGRGHVARVLGYLTYSAGAAWRLLRDERNDVVVAMTDPPILAALLALLARARGSRVVFWSQDIYPDLAARLGVIDERSALFRAIARVSYGILRRFDRIVAIGPVMAELLEERGIARERIRCVHNWSDSEDVRPVPPHQNPFLERHGLQGRFVVLYSGNAGRAHRFEAVLDAAEQLRDDARVVFLFIGGGPRSPWIQAEVARRELNNVRFLPYVAREELRYSLSSASAALVTESPAVRGLLVPSKLYGIMASARPLLYVGHADTDAARVVREHACGVVVSPDDADALARTIRRWADDPVEAARLGANGRDALVREYDRGIAAQRWDEVLTSLLPAQRRTTEPALMAG